MRLRHDQRTRAVYGTGLRGARERTVGSLETRIAKCGALSSNCRLCASPLDLGASAGWRSFLRIEIGPMDYGLSIVGHGCELLPNANCDEGGPWARQVRVKTLP
jgi:hypothetical protein